MLLEPPFWTGSYMDIYGFMDVDPFNCLAFYRCCVEPSPYDLGWGRYFSQHRNVPTSKNKKGLRVMWDDSTWFTILYCFTLTWMNIYTTYGDGWGMVYGIVLPTFACETSTWPTRTWLDHFVTFFWGQWFWWPGQWFWWPDPDIAHVHLWDSYMDINIILYHITIWIGGIAHEWGDEHLQLSTWWIILILK